MTCGYSVEWLRSCYVSSWRLFRDSATASRGFYYFSAPGTPHYPGLHNLGSYNWVNDDRQGDQPALGEVTPQGWDARPYVRGRLPVPQPPAVLIGDAECIRDGERLPLPLVPPRILIGGIDSRCYAAVPLAPPGVPWAWHRPETLTAYVEGDDVPLWEDSSIYHRPLKQALVPDPPQYFSALLGPRLRFSGNQQLLWANVINPEDYPDMGEEYSVYIKGFTSSRDPFTIGLWGPAVIWAIPGHVESPGYQFVTLYYGDAGHRLTAASPQVRYSPILLTLRRLGTDVELSNVGYTIAHLVTGHDHAKIGGVRSTRVFGDILRAEAFVFEVIVYDRRLTDAEHAACLSYFATKYP